MQVGLADGLLGECLRAEQARAVVGGGSKRGEEHETLGARTARRVDHPPGGDAVELLDRSVRLVARGGREVYDRVDAAHRVAKRRRVGEVAERDLHAHALGAEAARVAYEAAHVLAVGEQSRQKRSSDQPRRACEQQHGRKLAECAGG